MKVQARGQANSDSALQSLDNLKTKAKIPSDIGEKIQKQVNKANVKEDNKNNVKDGVKQLTEKELRKLEWEKKLAEQKVKDGDNKETKTLSKAELRANRREKQEADRLAKVVAPSAKSTEVQPKPELIAKSEPAVKKEVKGSNRKVLPRAPRKPSVNRKFKKDIHVSKVQLVDHLYEEKSPQSDVISEIIYNNIHPAFVKLGVQYACKTVLGSNARCLALLAALKHLVNDLQTPPKQEFSRYLEAVLKTNTNYLHECRPPAVSMTNALRHFKLHLTQLDTNLDDDKKRDHLQNVIDTYINDDIKKAGEAISIKVREKITNGDVILTYGW